MRLILDTNILVSAFIVPSGPPRFPYRRWRRGQFVLISSEDQLEEFRRVTRYPRLRKWFHPGAAGTMLNEIRGLAEFVGSLPTVDVSADPADNFLLAMAEAGNADYLITGDGRHLLNLKRHRSTRMITAKEAAEILG